MAQEGNTNAEKWTEEVVLDMCLSMVKGFKSKEYLFILEATTALDIPESTFYYLPKKFKENSVVLESLTRVGEWAKATLIGQGLRNEINPQLVKFICEASYGMSTKAEDMKTEALKRIVTTRVVAPIGMQERIEAIREDVKAKNATR